MDQTSSSQTDGPRHKRRWPGYLVSVVGLLVIVGVLVAAAIFNPTGRTGDAAGDGEGDAANLNDAFHDLENEASNKLTRNATVISPANARFDARRLAILNRGDHPIVRGVAETLAQTLAKAGTFETIDLYQTCDGRWPTGGEAMHDLYLTLRMGDCDVDGSLKAGLTVDAVVHARFSSELWGSRRKVIDDRSLPRVDINATLALKHHSVTTGRASKGRRFVMVINNIADQLAQSIRNEVAGLADKHGRPAPLPAAMYPAHRPAPDDLPLPSGPGLVRALDARGPMAHNRSLWIMPIDDPLPPMQRLHDQLKAGGWKVGRFDPSRPPVHLRATRGDQVFQAHAVQHGATGWGTRPDTLVIRYTERIARDRLDAALNALIDDRSCPADQLAGMFGLMDEPMRKRAIDRLTDTQGLGVEALLTVARHLHRLDRDEPAMAKLREAWLAACFAHDSDAEPIRKLAEEISGQADWAPAAPTDAELAAWGVPPLVEGEPITVEVGLGEPVRAYCRIQDESAIFKGLRLISTRVLPSAIPEGVYTLKLSNRSFETLDGSNHASTTHHPARPWQGANHTAGNMHETRVAAEEIGDNRFTITLTRHARTP